MGLPLTNSSRLSGRPGSLVMEQSLGLARPVAPILQSVGWSEFSRRRGAFFVDGGLRNMGDYVVSFTVAYSGLGTGESLIFRPGPVVYSSPAITLPWNLAGGTAVGSGLLDFMAMMPEVQLGLEREPTRRETRQVTLDRQETEIRLRRIAQQAIRVESEHALSTVARTRDIAKGTPGAVTRWELEDASDQVMATRVAEEDIRRLEAEIAILEAEKREIGLIEQMARELGYSVEALLLDDEEAIVESALGQKGVAERREAIAKEKEDGRKARDRAILTGVQRARDRATRRLEVMVRRADDSQGRLYPALTETERDVYRANALRTWDRLRAIRRWQWLLEEEQKRGIPLSPGWEPNSSPTLETLSRGARMERIGEGSPGWVTVLEADANGGPARQLVPPTPTAGGEYRNVWVAGSRFLAGNRVASRRLRWRYGRCAIAFTRHARSPHRSVRQFSKGLTVRTTK